MVSSTPMDSTLTPAMATKCVSQSTLMDGPKAGVKASQCMCT